MLRILLVCEGKVSEPQYFTEMKRVHKNRLVSIKIFGEGGAPVNVVEQAIRLRQEAMEKSKRENDPYNLYDEVWCAIDVDNHESLTRAKKLAEANNIQMAISNPCFELWLLLHFQDQRALISTRDAQRACKKHIANYEKMIPNAQIEEFYEVAVNRARILDQNHNTQGRQNENPSTGVYFLTEKIRRKAYKD